MKTKLLFLLAILFAIQGWANVVPMDTKSKLELFNSKGDTISLCDSISVMPWSDSFDTYGTGTTVFPTCWTRNTTYADRPYVNSTNFSPPGSLYFYAESGKYNIAALPPISKAIPINTLRLNFKYRKNNVADTLKIGVMTDPNDASTWTQVDYIVVPYTSTWYDAEILLSSYQGLGNYIAFRVDYSTTTAIAYIDDLVISYIPSCSKPRNLTFSNITTNSATLTWTPGKATDNTWWIYYKLSGTSNWNVDYSLTNSYSFNNLIPSSSYDIEIKTDCATETSEPSLPVSFRTACGEISYFPWTENFDTYGTGTGIYPACWSKINTYTSDRPYINTTHNSPPGGLFFYATKGYYNIATLPPIHSSISVNTLSLNFRLRKGATAYNITVGVMTDTALVSTFDSISNFSPSTNNIWEKFDIDLSSYTGNGKYIAFKVEGFGVTNGMYLDDLSVYVTPACSIPSGLISIDSSITNNSITLDWDGNDDHNVVSWIIDYKLVNDITWQSVSTYAHPYKLSNLQSSSVYDIRISAICSSLDTTFSSSKINVEMPCEPIVSFPWTEGFENTWFPASGVSSGTSPWCWTNIDGGSSSQNWRKTTSAAHIRSGSGAMQMYAANTSSSLSDWMITPVISLSGNESLTFWAKGYNNTYVEELNLQIFNVTTNGIVDNESDTNLFNVIMPNTIIPNLDWRQYEINLNQFIGDYQIAFVRNTTKGYYLNIDDVSIYTIPQCGRASFVKFKNITSNSVNISWTPARTSDSAWWVYYRQTGSLVWDSIHTNRNPITINNLNPYTEYEIEIITDCGSELSSPSILNTFTTYCVPITSIPFTENFDTYGGSGENYFPDCWSKISTHPKFPYLHATNRSASASFYLYTTTGHYILGILHEIDPSIPINSLMISIWMRNGNSSSNCIVGIMDSLDDHTTFTPIDTIAPSVTSAWENFEIYLNTYTGSGRYITFKSECISGINQCYLDDLIIDYIPPCPLPVQLNISNITTSSVDISWVAGDQTSNSWWIFYKEDSSNNYDSVYVTNATTYTITNLNPATKYDYYLITVCGIERSLPTNIEKFFTQCSPINSFPWIEGFEKTWIPGVGVSNDDVPNLCWVNINSGTGTVYKWKKSTSITIPEYVRNGTGSAQLYGNNQTMGDYLMTPVISFTGKEELIFWGKGYSDLSNYPENLWIKAYNVTANGDIASFSDTTLLTNLAFINDTNCYTWNEYTIPLTSLIGDYRLAFSRDNNIGYYYQLDDLQVSTIPACSRPISVSFFSISQNSANITWVTGDTNDNSWKIYYRLSGAQIWDSVVTTNNPHTLTGLLANSLYEIGVATNCGNGEFSNLILTSFKTTCGPITSLPWTDYFDTYGTGTSVFPDCWTRNTTQTDRPYVDGMTSSASKPGSLHFYTSIIGTYNIAATPAFDQTINISSLKATFKFKNTYSTDILKVGVMTDPNLESTFVVIDTISAITTNTWYDDTVYFSSYTGTGQCIAFRLDNTGTATHAYIDNLEVSYQIVCNAPTNVVANNITHSSADISWTASGTETSWQIKEGSLSTPIDVLNPSFQATGLSPITTYTFYVRSNCGNGVYSNWVLINFTTIDIPSDPIVSTSNITAFTHNTATFTGSYIKRSDSIAGIGFNYKTQASNNWINESITPITTPFNFNASGLTPNTAYQVIAYATTQAGTFYGDTITFTTSQFFNPTATTDTVIVNNKNKSAIFKGTTSQGTNSIIARGFEYKLNSEDWSKAIDLTATGSGNITTTATSLQFATYNVRAYAETNEGKAYGNILTFTISQTIPPTVTTSSVSNITHNTATFNGYYTQGTDSIIGIGFKYKPQTSNNWNNESITPISSPFTYNASGINPNTNYQVIAYAETQAGIFYGDTIVFYIPSPSSPIVTTDTVIVDNTNKSAIFKGTTAQGTDAIISRGFEYKAETDNWSNAINLTAIGSNNITANATTLEAKKYNVRAYAETQEGKTYGNALDFEIVSSLDYIKSNNLEVNLYPNPASNEATLSIKGINGKASIIITDVQGRTINKFDKEGISGEIKYSLDLSNYAKGVYYIRIQNSNSIKTQKLIVQ